MADREMIINGCENWVKNHKDESLLLAYSAVEDLLAVLKEQKEVEPKTGHWIWLQNCANEGVYCSECHTKMFDRYPMKKKLSQFCGHCGAKMDDQVEGR